MTQRAYTVREAQELAEHIGEFILFWGFKRVHGRIWTHLTISAKPLDAAELMRRLNISKALASMSLGEMLRQNVIQVAGKSTKGTQLYKANPDLFAVIARILREREHEMMHRIHRSAVLLRRLPERSHRQHELSSQNIARLENVLGGTVKALEVFMKNFRFDLSKYSSIQLSATPARARH